MIEGAVAPRGTFRDPAGSLYFDQAKVFRQVRPAFAAEAESFLCSPLAGKWIESGRMVSTAIASREADGSLLLEHERIDYPTYPWEWTPGQWAAAGELTLDLCEESLAAGLILKDATPLNVLFRNADPVFVDVLSFDKRQPSDPSGLPSASSFAPFCCLWLPIATLAGRSPPPWSAAMVTNRRTSTRTSRFAVAGPPRCARSSPSLICSSVKRMLPQPPGPLPCIGNRPRSLLKFCAAR